MDGPLSAYTVLELAGIGPGPYAGQLMADLGAKVISIERPTDSSIPGNNDPVVPRRGKNSITLDLRKPEAGAVLLEMVKGADVLLEGNRPGVMERLGLGPEICQGANPALIYARMTGWGQTGPWAKMAGHDINYISITGALQAMGRSDRPPDPPLNLIGDYGGGSMIVIMGILAALLKRHETGKGEVIDAAMIDGVSSMMGMIYSRNALGLWSEGRGENMLDGSRPYYRCYETRDKRYMAAGCIEPKFFKIFLSVLEIDPEDFGPQNDQSLWPEQHKRLEAKFAMRTMKDWADIFDGTDACVTPVLDFSEAAVHKQNAARGGLKTHDGLVHPRTIPVLASRPNEPTFKIAKKNSEAHAILAEFGFNREEIARLENAGIIHSS